MEYQQPDFVSLPFFQKMGYPVEYLAGFVKEGACNFSTSQIYTYNCHGSSLFFRDYFNNMNLFTVNMGVDVQCIIGT
ncbi:hypothetical protein SDC9_99884 [bioreactor metagenome]|uniref:Uncharacterized protein n=1 Tax=bioreactor metagenome TaxID=1076179 RepID=A0A645AJ17_9ZZZZ